MLELYYKYPRVLRRLRNGGLGDEMDRISAYLSEHGYKRGSARVYLSRLGKFSDHLSRAARATLIEQTVIDRFIGEYSSETPRLSVRAAIELARRVAPERFSIPSVEPDPHQPLLNAYLDHLRRIRGLEPKTCEGRLLAARRVLAWHDVHVPGQPLAMMTSEHVLAVVEHLLALSSNPYTRSATTSYVRVFLRFLHWSDLNGQDLARFVPRTPCYQLAHLPPHLAWEDIRRVIDAIDAATPVDVRDRAILLLVATTGLRNKELRALELEDIHWRKAEVVVRRTKAKRDRVVPLLQEAGEALANYVLHARPKSDSPRVFLQHIPPVRPIDNSGVISRIVRSTLERGGLQLPRVAGAHLVRHSLATQLVSQRRPINEVADLLGHRSIDTTAIYVKVAVTQLADVALPFPGSAP
ncbi:site-specific integrase [Acidiphilium multivorum]|uniref:site-specific integrase n=1 Tax=Acidiphilium multivorum TaxID=62140 RepID=UPI001B8D6C3F|nr:site-specific integrase [Acidiphilium multivorum]MBS3025496.1 tyrosine-type recombinase/integrase [Acidiphilium multivorum]